MRQPMIYGAVVAVAVFFVGWVTGLGGTFLPNLLFSVVVGVFAMGCMWAVLRFAGPKGGDRS